MGRCRNAETTLGVKPTTHPSLPRQSHRDCHATVERASLMCQGRLPDLGTALCSPCAAPCNRICISLAPPSLVFSRVLNPHSPGYPSSCDCGPDPPSCSAETGPQPRLRNAAPLRDARLGATPHLAVHWQCGGGSLWRPHSLLLTAGGALRQRPRTMQVGRARVWSGTPQPPPHSRGGSQAVRQ